MDAENEIANLRAKLAEAHRQAEKEAQRAERERCGREEADRQREEADRQREEADRRREEADRRLEAAESLNREQTLIGFLRSCHDIHKLIKPAKLSFATGGATTDPTSRFYPQHILPWEAFASMQAREWDQYDQSFWEERKYPSAANMNFLKDEIDPIDSEDELRYQQRSTVENLVKKIFPAEQNGAARPTGTVTFENQAAFREAESDRPSHAMGPLSVSGSESAPQQRRNTRADQFCVLWNKDGSARPVVAIEYKAPHKLTIEDICTGLQSAIHPKTDVISRDEHDYVSLCRRLMAAVVTQVFSYMIDKGVRHGYISTGETFIFVHIGDDPKTVYYSVNVPTRDWDEDEQHQLQRTAVGQVFAFIQQALAARPASQEWVHRARQELERWQVEYIDILQQIPETERRSGDASEYRPHRWISSPPRRSPIMTRSCHPRGPTQQEDESDEENGSPSVSPVHSPTPRTRSQAKRNAEGRGRTTQRGDRRSQSGETARVHSGHCPISINDRPYCTHACLLALCEGQSLDVQCPNFADHDIKLTKAALLHKTRTQLATDMGEDADCCPLYIHGAQGALFKIRLICGGYTFVAKAVERGCEHHLFYEETMYKHLRPLQGDCVPVCCGVVELERPYYYDGVKLASILVLSWAGVSMATLCLSDPAKAATARKAKAAFKAINELKVTHGDVAPRNILYDARADRVMIVDFERSSLAERHVLGDLSPNRKRPFFQGQNARKLRRVQCS